MIVINHKQQTALGLAKATATNKDAGNPDFVGLHKMAKHIIYLKEGSDAAILILSHLQKFHDKLLARPPQGDHALPIMHLTDQMLAQKAVQFEVWQLRMASMEQRMQNIINLVSHKKLGIAPFSTEIHLVFQRGHTT